MFRRIVCCLILLCFVLLTAASVAPADTLSPTKSGGDATFGSGIPSDGFTVSTTGANGETVALKARDRDTGQPNGKSGNVYYVDPGISSSSITTPNLMFDYQFSPGPMGNDPEDYRLCLLVDFDPAYGVTSFATIDWLVADGDITPDSWDETDGFLLNPGPGAWSDDAVDFVVGNSWGLHYTFWPFFGGSPYNPFQPAEFEIWLIVKDLQENIVAQTMILARVVPEPGTGMLLVIGAMTLFLQRRRSL